MEVPRFRWSEPGRWRLSLAPASVGRGVLPLNRQHGFFPLHSWVAYKKKHQTTRSNIAGNQRTCYVKLLCNRSLVLVLRAERMGGDSNPRCLSAHTLSRRAQSTTLSPILSGLIVRGSKVDYEHDEELQSQSTEQFCEWQLNSDVKFAEIRILGADGIETHFVNDRFDLKCIAREQRHAPFRVIEAGRARDKLFHFAGELASNSGVPFHQFAALIIRQRIPIPLFAAAFAHVIKANDRPVGQRGINALLPVMFYPLVRR